VRFGMTVAFPGFPAMEVRKMQADRPRDLTRTTFQLLALGVLIASTFWILRPFLAALTWATMIAVATWPLLLRAQAWLGGRRSLAVALMTITLLLIVVVPLYFGVAAIADNTEEIVRWSKSLATFAVPQPPAWLEGLPLIGRKLTVFWQHLAATPSEDLAARFAPYARAFVLWFVSQMGNIGMLLVQFLLTVIIAAILYANGGSAAQEVDRFARRLAGAQGETRCI
jgi:predicted PurR-regulated permease PerM